MSTKKNTKGKSSGLGRSLGELLMDNEELGNIENRVLMHKNDGTTVKIYNKVDKQGASAPAAVPPVAPPGKNASFETSERIPIGKTREEREEEARGVYRSGKPHVVSEGEHVERIRVSAKPKEAPEPERIVLDGSSRSSKGSISDSLAKLKRYSPSASDEFLEALRDMTEVRQGGDYQTDKDGRIIIGATKSRVKKRKCHIS